MVRGSSVELRVVVRLALHDNILAEVLIAVHASRELGTGADLLVVIGLTLHDDVLTKVLVTVHAGGELGAGANLVVVVRLTLHDDVLAEILVTVHASSELDHGIIDGEAGDVWDARLLAGSQLDEASGGGNAFVVGKDLSGLG